MLNLTTIMGLSQYIINETHKRNMPINNIALSQLITNINKSMSKKTGKQFLTDKQKAEYEPRPIIPEIYHRYMMYGLDPIPKSEVTTQIAKNGIIKNKVDTYLNEYFAKRGFKSN